MLMNKLWICFKNKIKEDWILKYSGYGTFNDIESQTNFCRALEEDIYKTLNISRREKKLVPSWNTLNNYLKQDGFGKYPKQKTLDLIAKYIGFQNYKDFVKKLPVDSDKVIEKKHIENSQNNSNPQISFKYIGLVIFSVLTLVVIILLSNWTSENDSRLEKEKIHSLIERANLLEFDLYAAVPDLSDTSSLDVFYTKDSPSKQGIIDILKRNKLKGNVLDAENSSRFLNNKSVFFEKINKNFATVRTVEFWELYWVKDSLNLKVAEYVVANEQKYLLEKINNNWKITLNDYIGEAKRYKVE